MNKPTLLMLIGLPGTGKSTWFNDYLNLEENYYVLSTDMYIESAAHNENTTYDEAFDKHIKQATKELEVDVKYVRDCRADAVWDQTNLTVASRAKKLAKLPNHKKIAVVFECDEVEHVRRLASRPGKTIPQHVLNNMRLERPTKDEGFDEIWTITQ
jgi:predicted kinase